MSSAPTFTLSKSLGTGIVARSLDALARDDWKALLDELDPQVEVVEPPDMPDPEVYRGRDGLFALLTHLREQFELIQIEAERVLHSSNRVVIGFRVVATGKISGARVEGHHAAVLTLREQRIRRIEGHTSWDSALESIRD